MPENVWSNSAAVTWEVKLDCGNRFSLVNERPSLAGFIYISKGFSRLKDLKKPSYIEAMNQN